MSGPGASWVLALLSKPVTTIAWRLGHLLAVFGPPGIPHFDLAVVPPPELRFRGTAAEALRRLDEGHDAWLADVRLLGADGLTRPQGALSRRRSRTRRWPG